MQDNIFLEVKRKRSQVHREEQQGGTSQHSLGKANGSGLPSRY